MSLRRFFIADLSPQLVSLEGDEAQHARKVMRLQAGDAVELLDGRGGVARAEVVEVGRSVELRITERRTVARDKPEIDLAVAIPKGDRASVLVEKASELGADRLIPLICERSVVEPREGKIERFERITRETAKQCGRAWLMRIEPPTELSRVLKEAEHDVKLIADLAADGGTGVQELLTTARRVIVLVGPEGDWTQAEKSTAFAAGFRPWRLGPHVLRVETAAVAALAILRHQTYTE